MQRLNVNIRHEYTQIKNEDFNCYHLFPPITLRKILNKLPYYWKKFSLNPVNSWMQPCVRPILTKREKRSGYFYIWPVPLCYQSMHSNLKEKRQILRDTVNHIQTIHKEKGVQKKEKIERAYLQNDLTFYIWENTHYAV